KAAKPDARAMAPESSAAPVPEGLPAASEAAQEPGDVPEAATTGDAPAQAAVSEPDATSRDEAQVPEVPQDNPL
ncbi:MAG: hypothetical protein IKD70_06305, partial [Eggerthellaceae bacterium]|nr:hypothetical protein [Eggerthellaceae bacterium]